MLHAFSRILGPIAASDSTRLKAGARVNGMLLSLRLLVDALRHPCKGYQVIVERI